MDITPEWTFWTFRWALLTTGIAAQAVALAACVLPRVPTLRVLRPAPPHAAPQQGHAAARHAASACSAPTAPASPRNGHPSPCSAPACRMLLLSGAVMTCGFALLERDILLLAAQCILLPLFWRRMRQG